ncbi:MAG TPA: hypothetical protein VF230_08300 [Acidimicrobiales bacterium]
MDALPDGSYDVIVIDADAMHDDSVRLELTITSGARIGDVVTVRASSSKRDPLLLLGVPGTLRVERGVPYVELEN